MSEANTTMVTLTDGNKGSHPIIGAATKTFYGYRKTGDEFLVHQSDLEAMPKTFTAKSDKEDKKAKDVDPVKAVLEVKPEDVAATDRDGLKVVAPSEASAAAEATDAPVVDNVKEEAEKVEAKEGDDGEGGDDKKSTSTKSTSTKSTSTKSTSSKKS